MNAQRKDRTEVDLKWLTDTHRAAKQLGMSDTDIIKVAETEGGIDQKAMRQYKAKYEEAS
jgi:hypothetical protein